MTQPMKRADEDARNALVCRAKAFFALPISQIATLMGENPQSLCEASNSLARLLVDEARAGRLQTETPIDKHPDGSPRPNPWSTRVGRWGLAKWFAEYGTLPSKRFTRDVLRDSDAFRWAGDIPTAAMEAEAERVEAERQALNAAFVKRQTGNDGGRDEPLRGE
jgi:hypothetical protein